MIYVSLHMHFHAPFDPSRSFDLCMHVMPFDLHMHHVWALWHIHSLTCREIGRKKWIFQLWQVTGLTIPILMITYSQPLGFGPHEPEDLSLGTV